MCVCKACKACFSVIEANTEGKETYKDAVTESKGVAGHLKRREMSFGDVHGI